MLRMPGLPVLLFLIFSTPLVLVLSGNVQQGGLCNPADDRLDPASHEFLSDCDTSTFCYTSNATSIFPSNYTGPPPFSTNLTGSTSIPNGTCQPRRCRRDQYPFGYDSSQPLPPLCAANTFCPDEGSGCKPLAGPGQPCQLNRDDQCAPPPNWNVLASSQNSNGSLCLRSICTYANASLGQACIIDDVTYITAGPGGAQYSNTISRDNCQSPRFYCNASSTLCVMAKSLGMACSADSECQSYNCGPQGVCAQPPEMPVQVAAWQYAVTSGSVILAMIVTIIMLVMLHKRLRLRRYREIRDYYEEQLRLRRTIVALHTAVAERYADETCDKSVGGWQEWFPKY